MPDTTLHPTGQKPKSEIIADVPMTHYAALRRINFFSTIDFLFLFLIIAGWITLLFWKIFAHPEPFQVLSCVIFCFSVMQVWSLIVAYRCMHFVVMTQTYINLLPENAAKIVMAAYSGGAANKP